MQFLITAPIFLMIAIGYGAVRSGLVTKEMVGGIGRFVLYFATPAVIFRALSTTEFRDVLNIDFILAYGGGALVTFILFFVLSRLLWSDQMTVNGLNALGTALPNSIFIGLPVVSALFDALPVAAFTMVLVIENVVIFTLALIVMDLGDERGSGLHMGDVIKGVVKRLATNPMLLAIVAGLTASAFGLELPSVLAKVVDMLAGAASAGALFFVGGVLVGTSIKGQISSIVGVGLGKLIVYPLAVAVIVQFLPDLDPMLRKAAILFACSPMFAIYPIVASKYGLAQESSSKLLLTTALSFITISVAITLVG